MKADGEENDVGKVVFIQIRNTRLQIFHHQNIWIVQPMLDVFHSSANFYWNGSGMLLGMKKSIKRTEIDMTNFNWTIRKKNSNFRLFTLSPHQNELLFCKVNKETTYFTDMHVSAH